MEVNSQVHSVCLGGVAWKGTMDFFVLGRCLNQMMSSFSLLLWYEIPGSSKGPWVFGSAKCIIL